MAHTDPGHLSTSPMWCVVPVAGRGTRLGAELAGGSKALLEVGGRSLLDRLLERLAPSVVNFCLVVDGLDTPIRQAVGQVAHATPVHYAVQARPRGLADAVAQAAPLVTGPFLVAMGDSYYEGSLTPCVDAWRRSRFPGGILVEPAISAHEDDPVGLVEVVGDRVKSAFKAPLRGRTDLLRIAGLLMLPEVALGVCREMCRTATDEVELEDVVTRLLRGGVRFQATPYPGWRRNVNTPADLAAVRRRLKEPRSSRVGEVSVP